MKLPAVASAESSGFSPAHRVLLAALALLFASQFLPYKLDSRHSDLSIGPGFAGSTVNTAFGAPGGTGWQLHPYALYVFVALGVLFITDLHQEPALKRSAYWIALPLVAYLSMGVAADTLGAKLGLVALLLVGVAIYLNRRENSPAAPPSNAPPPNAPPQA